MDELSSNDFLVIDGFCKEELYQTIREIFMQSLPLFKKAGIGALGENTVHTEIRGDHTYWLDRVRDEHLIPFWALVDETMMVFNRYCFLGLSGYEFHFANYPPGTHYAKHVDQFKNRNNRLISFIIYLNEDWEKGDGGELEIYRKDKPSVIVEPIAGRCVMFKSAVVPHRVMKSLKNRYSLTGWFLNDPSSIGKFMS
jgi:SM-20-related protein